VWVGTRRPLSAYREGVLRVDSLGEATTFLAGLGEIVGGLAPFEKRRARETIWDIVACLAETKDAPVRLGSVPRSVA
jgi:hypothetical protein